MEVSAHGQKPEAAAKQRREATYEDLLKVPEHKVAEIIDGELIVSPRPASYEAYAKTCMISALVNAFDNGPGGQPPPTWWILHEPELHLGRDVLVPDLVGWRRTRMPILPNVAACTLVPDWVCEITSPEKTALDRVRKIRAYARAKVANYWIVDPYSQSLEVFRQSGDLWMLVAAFEGSEAVRAEPFDAVELDMSRWWVPEAPESSAPDAPAADAGPSKT